MKAAVSLLASFVLAVSAGCAPASAQPTSAHGWFQNAWTIHVLNGTDPAAAAWAFSQPSSYGSGNPPTIRDGFAATPVYRETSYAQLQQDLAAGVIPAGETVSYDTEKWANTPLAEQQSPVYYMEQFALLAHSYGHPVALLPARDLGLVDTECAKVAGENLDQWFVRCDIAQAAAGADLFQVQSQVDTTDLAEFGWLVTNVAAQARAANPSVLFFDGISSNYGTPAQAVAAEQSVASVIDGTYVTCANSDVSWEAQVLDQLMQTGTW